MESIWQRLSWPQVAALLILVAGIVAVLVAVPTDKLTAIPWEGVIGILAVLVGGSASAMSGPLLRPRSGVTVPPPRDVRTRPTDPPSRTGGFIATDAMAFSLLWSLLALAALAHTLSGCVSTIGTQARIATASLVTVDGIQRFADSNHATAIAACPEPGDPGRIPCIDAADATWIPVGESADGAGVGVVTWIGTLEVARMAEGDVEASLVLAMQRAIEVIRPAFVLAICRGADLPDWLLPIFGVDPATACEGS